MKTLNTILEVPFNDDILSVKLQIEYHIVDFGIGHYEYWGIKGYDSRPGVEINQVIYDQSFFTAEQNAAIEEKIDNTLDDLAELCKVS